MRILLCLILMGCATQASMQRQAENASDSMLCAGRYAASTRDRQAIVERELARRGTVCTQEMTNAGMAQIQAQRQQSAQQASEMSGLGAALILQGQQQPRSTTCTTTGTPPYQNTVCR